MANLPNSFRRADKLSDLERAITCCLEALRLTNDGHPDKPSRLNNLGNAFLVRFRCLGELNDLEQAISKQSLAAQIVADSHPAKAGYLSDLADSFFTRFERVGEPTDLERAISNYQEAVWLTPDGHPNKPSHLNNLGNSLHARFRQLGQLGDLEQAIANYQEAVRLIPDGHPDKPGHLNNLGNSLHTRFHQLGQLGDLEQAIANYQEAIRLTPDGHPNKPRHLNSLGNSFLTRFELLNDLSNFEQSISKHNDAIELIPDGHPGRASFLSDLSKSFFTGFRRLGKLSILEQAISKLRDAIEHTPGDHPNKHSYLDNHAAYLRVGVEHLTWLINTHSPHLFALIIGISNYTNVTKVYGAVADAQTMKEYLQEVYQVPEDHIRTLLDSDATRDAIIMAFKDLPDDQRIRSGDPIVIFYAGHGSELPAPPSWGRESKIQCLLPHDYEATGTMPIPDRTIGALIEGIASAKGNNITVIFDCCHSASGARDQGEEYVPRTVDLGINIPETLDNDIWGSPAEAGLVSNGSADHGLRSRVVLAACGEKGCTYEYDGRGQFTSVPLATPESCPVSNLIYTEVLERIRFEKQNPHYEGLNQHPVLFGARVPAGRQVQVWYPVRAEVRSRDEISMYVIGAGLSHGIARGVEFTLYSNRKLRLGTVLVDDTSSIDDFETTITTSVQFANVSFAKRTRIGKVPIYVDNYSVFGKTLRSIDGNGTNAANFRIVTEVEEAKLQVSIENDLVIFKILDQRVQSFGLTELPHKATIDRVNHVLCSAAHYFSFLDLAREGNWTSTRPDVAVDFYLLSIDYDDSGPFLSPVEPGFCQKDSNSDSSDVIDFVVDPEAFYGIKIMNRTPWDLYLNAFLFDNSSLSIVPYYTQSSAREPEAPLKQGGTFTVGYGPAGETLPFSYSLGESQDVDVGYLKIFFATRFIDLSNIEQVSPFSNMHLPPADCDGTQKLVLPRTSDIWFAVLIPVVQRRRGMDAMAY